MDPEQLQDTVLELQQHQQELQDFQLHQQEQLLQLHQRLLEFEGKQTEDKSAQQMRELRQLHELCYPETRGRNSTMGYQITRDQRIQIRTLRDANWTYQRIATHLKVTHRQVQYAVSARSTSPLPRSGRPAGLTPDQIQQLVEYVISSKEGRRMIFGKIPDKMGWDCSEYTVRYALRRAGFKKYPAVTRLPINDETQQLRLDFAYKHVNWTIDQWKNVLWSAEKWFAHGKPSRVWVTRKPEEEYDQDCIIEEAPKEQGQLFWGCFSALKGKGPGVSWEYGWGSVGPESYYRRVFPTLSDWLDLHPKTAQFYTPDPAPAHAALATLEEVRGRRMAILKFPPSSTDLNPLSTVWTAMRDSIEKSGKTMDGYAMAENLKKAWDEISEDYLRELVESMPARCQAVIDAKGLHTRF
ncbi:hypothetical protein FZEAL_7660 [Fusarium zealandicum]|uniref:Transposase n=1 Tax=Fusarium zealandicum TaxID=1053134 RepID=A0A8H4UFF4_9HYPO|nr:hypothetical protein FZEAL_7660 [Fusarium zealandicum]